MAQRRGGTATEKPTPERLREARRRGQVAISSDLTAALVLAAALGVFAFAAPAGVARLLTYFRGQLGHAAFAGDLAAAGDAALAVALPVVLVPLAVVLAATLVFGALQTGGLFAWPAARPSLDRVSFLAGLRRLFGAATAGVTARAFLKVALVVAVAATVVAPLVRALPALVRGTPATILPAVGTLGLRLAVRLVVAAAAWGALDWVLARWRLQRDLAMTRDEVKREQRQREGEPLQRAERRRVHRQLAEQAAPEDAGAADFVVVGEGANGDELAAAVFYDRTSGRAPEVVVAGRQLAARRIEEVARAAAIRVHRDSALALALVDVPAPAEIPDACFEAVAALL